MYACLDGNTGSLQEICRKSNEQLMKNVHKYSCFFCVYNFAVSIRISYCNLVFILMQGNQDILVAKCSDFNSVQEHRLCI